ncbi:MAG: endonuclease III [Bacteroidales bacterium]|jgi:endonuclease-3|nr:endonuclease III [Bacteroidales bacterium]
MTKKERYSFVIDYFKAHNPHAASELQYTNAYQLLVAVILSAQCTDKRVNMVTPPLLEAYPTPNDLKNATVDDIYHYIKSVSYPNNKAKHLKGMATVLVDEFNSIVPEDIDNLQKLPGVGRKTANVIASVIYNKPTMAVDTHVFRVSKRIGLVTNAKTPLETERQLIENISEEFIPVAHHWLILHGRYVCTARNPKCEQCGIDKVCQYFEQKTKQSQTV